MSEPRNTELYSEFAGNPGLKNRPGPAVGLVRACERIEGLEAQLEQVRTALKNLLAACEAADNAGELDSRIDGELIDAAHDALTPPEQEA